MIDATSAPLYDPSFEHDGCGVGFVANISGRAEHSIIERAAHAVRCVAHRGAIASDELTGDGAGLSFEVPTPFFQQEYARLTRLAAPDGPIGVGVFFLPPAGTGAYPAFKSLVEEVLLKRGLSRFVWRPVPRDIAVLGEKALATLPAIEQLLIRFPAGTEPIDVDRQLYVTRREIEARAAWSVDTGLYIVSFSCRSIVYKGLMQSKTLSDFYPDLLNPDLQSRYAIFHQRYSTNTFPNWQLAQPFRMSAHNGEINTIQGNRYWTRAREPEIASEIWGDDVRYLEPIITEGASDSASLDNVLELLALSGRPLHHCVAMLIREAWRAHAVFNESVQAFNEFSACLNEPWDGPAALIFGDGNVVGAALDRNGLRPARYKVTRDGLIILGSEVGLLDLDDTEVVEKGRIGPGHMLVVDLVEGRLIKGKEIKQELAARKPYRDWIRDKMVKIPELPIEVRVVPGECNAGLARQQIAFGYSSEEIRLVLEPMATEGKEPTGSMGNDAPLSVLSTRARLLPSYFKQRFAQVTNPPIDSIRERAVMSLVCNLGRRRNWLSETADHARQLQLAGPVISDADLAHAREAWGEDSIRTISILFDAEGGTAALLDRLDAICNEAEEAVDAGCELLVLSDRLVDAKRAPIPILLAVGTVTTHLLRVGKRLRASVIAESGEPRDVHQVATLIGYGAGAIVPYLAYRTIAARWGGDGPEAEQAALDRYRSAIHKGLLKVMAKMGISVLGSYRGARIFEALGIGREVIARSFAGTPSPLGGIGWHEIARDALARHDEAWSSPEEREPEDLGIYRFKKGGEPHAWSPPVQRAILRFKRDSSPANFTAFSAAAHRHPPIAPRDLLAFKRTQGGVPIDEVEPIEAIRRRFTTAGMSLGALSPETHETLAIAMNRIGGLSNTGEGGEDAARFYPLPNGDSKNSGIKQVASGRFGVTPEYLRHAREIEIKMAQGSKPGEGGQLPGHKVTSLIARLRRAVPGMTLISPPPHHDIYSIEDLSQLIYDLKQVNPSAKVTVKLVAEVGVGTIAAGVAKALADVILVSGHDGGTGASPLASVRHAGSPWELGLAEAQQVLMLNGLRERVTLRTDGGLKTGRDIVVAAMLGADEYNFGTAALIALGCRYVRLCHTNRCPVGIATQDEELRKKFDGTPENLIQYLNGVSQEVREILAQLGVRTIDEVIGRADLLEMSLPANAPADAALLDLSPLIAPPPAGVTRHRVWERNTKPPECLNDRLVRHARAAVESGVPVKMRYKITNLDRTIGASVAGEIAQRHGEKGLPAGTVEVFCEGTAGQSFGAFCANGMRLVLRGEANDYVGKSMNGGEIVVIPPSDTPRETEKDLIIGNTCLYGATGGAMLIRGLVGERFGVRNSGGRAVVEGTGDHACEYMTNGVVVVIGPTGRNFGAGMTGGVAYVLDDLERFPNNRCNHETVELVRPAGADLDELRDLIELHLAKTGSPRADRILADWDETMKRFWKVIPKGTISELEPAREPATTVA